MGDLIIEVKNLKRTYSGRVPVKALRGVSFSLQKGEFVALMGRSGSGKSTLLHQLGLIDTPTGGEIIIDGRNVLTLPPKETAEFRLNEIGYIFQEFAILTEFTALDNVCVPLLAKGMRMKDAREKAAEMLGRVGLAHRLNHYPNELSGGEQQRTVIARALINSPKIILADEPTANLDSDSALAILELMARLSEELNQTILMISHEPEDKKWTDRVIWLKDGEIERIEKIKNKLKPSRHKDFSSPQSAQNLD